MGKYVMPQRIVVAENVEQAEKILIEKELQACFNNDDCINVKKGGYILLDFGVELSGGIAFTVQYTSSKMKSAKMRLVFGESVSEAMSKIGEKNATNNHSNRDMIIDVSSLSTYHYGKTGFRFVKIQAIDADIYVKAIKAETDIRDIEWKGSFKCNDELLNEIWRVGAYTVQLNMHDFIWDGVKRDRLVWIGDMHPEISTVKAVFGQDASVPASLDFIRDCTPANEWMNGIITYSMWWIIIHYDWYMHWGDYDYLKQQKEYLIVLVNKIIAWINDVSFNYDGMKGFVDWSSKDTFSEIEGRKAVLCISLDRVARLLDILEEKDVADECRRNLSALLDEKIEKESNRRISALTVLSGRNADLAKQVLKGNSAEELSCFMGYYVLKAKALFGDTNEALDIIREYWGGMLKMGATTFWEDFDIRWMKNATRIDEMPTADRKDIHGDFGKHCYEGFRHSLCHGWSSGPTPFLMEQIGGIEILEAGCKKLKITPQLGDLEWIRIEYPTPFGNVLIESKKQNEKIITDITAPDEIEVIR